VIFLPNSPRWLAQKGRHVEAEEVLRMLRDTSEKAREELNEIRESLKLKQGAGRCLRSTATCAARSSSACCCRRCSSSPA
jgi:SP family arabinose:H+ symporter-like MFS transporter